MKLHARGESGLYPALAIAIVIILFFALPNRYRLGTPWFAVVLAFVVLVATVGPLGRFGAGRAIAIGIIAALTALNVFYLVSLIDLIANPAVKVEATRLFSSATAIWLSNIVIFALWYWEVDRGGPESRVPGARSSVDLQFPTPESSDWQPTFPDYAFVAFTTATAFSPTDTLPLTHRAKLLMATESLISLVTIAVVAARALNL